MAEYIRPPDTTDRVETSVTTPSGIRVSVAFPPGASVDFSVEAADRIRVGLCVLAEEIEAMTT